MFALLLFLFLSDVLNCRFTATGPQGQKRQKDETELEIEKQLKLIGVSYTHKNDEVLKESSIELRKAKATLVSISNTVRSASDNSSTYRRRCRRKCLEVVASVHLAVRAQPAPRAMRMAMIYREQRGRLCDLITSQSLPHKKSKYYYMPHTRLLRPYVGCRCDLRWEALLDRGYIDKPADVKEKVVPML